MRGFTVFLLPVSAVLHPGFGNEGCQLPHASVSGGNFIIDSDNLIFHSVQIFRFSSMSSPWTFAVLFQDERGWLSPGAQWKKGQITPPDATLWVMCSILWFIKLTLLQLRMYASGCLYPYNWNKRLNINLAYFDCKNHSAYAVNQWEKAYSLSLAGRIHRMIHGLLNNLESHMSQ